MWTWVRDRRFPALAKWFNEQVAADRVLVCDLVVLELVRLAPNESQARGVQERLEAFESIPMGDPWRRIRELQLHLASNGDHRRVPPIDLMLATTAEQAGVPIVHYDRDYARIANVSGLQHHWFVPDGTLA